MPNLNAFQARQVLDYDPQTGRLTWKRRPSNCVKIGDEAGGPTSTGYRQVGVFGNIYLVHRIAYLIMVGHWPFQYIDHANGERDDNRWVNIRACSHAHNMANCKTYKSNSLGLKGVVRHRNRFMARIKLNGKMQYLGLFDTPEEAHGVFVKAHREAHGEFSRIA